ncbi:MAG: nucleotidyl transferase AbiEii/AbiGii toxin family protein [Verrucomicrobia bacterium]|nr:nucleotidyl transferase AbiEii/AbiGii toxin family protein [Verrucomicrobiota bacterium]
MSFAPQLHALPAAQRTLWPNLKQVPRHFVLYGGTALVLRLGHRQSLDFDFFTSAPVEPSALKSSLPFLAGATVLQVAPNTLTVSVPCSDPVKLSFFGGLKLGRVGDPETTDDGVVRVASLLDVAACKMAVLPERAEAKDYLDVYALLQHGVTLPQALGAAQAVYGDTFNPMPALKALSYFRDGDLPTLPDAVRQTLRTAAARFREITTLERRPGGLVPAGE